MLFFYFFILLFHSFSLCPSLAPGTRPSQIHSFGNEHSLLFLLIIFFVFIRSFVRSLIFPLVIGCVCVCSVVLNARVNGKGSSQKNGKEWEAREREEKPVVTPVHGENWSLESART